MQSRKILLGSLAVGMFLSLLVVPTKAMSASVVLYASADTYISSKNLMTNYGTNEYLELAYITSGGNDQRHVLLKFDLSTIPSTAVITDARVRLYQVNPSACDGVITPNEVTLRKKWDSWEETEMDWTGGFSNVAITTRTGSCSTNWGFIVTDTVQDWVNGEENNGFILMGFSSTVYTRFFYSREHATNMPQLDVSYTIPDSSTSTSTSTSTSVSTASTPATTSTSTASTVSTTSSDISTSSEETVETEVQAPELTGIERNGVSLFATWDGVDLGSDDVLSLSGVAAPGATVTVSVDDVESTVVADGDGNWTIDIQAQDFSMGEHIITAKASLDGDESNEEPMVMINVLGAEEEAVSEVGSAVTSSVGTVLVVLAAFFALFVIIGGIVLVIVLKRKKAPVVEEVKTEEKITTEKVVEEDTIKPAEEEMPGTKSTSTEEPAKTVDESEEASEAK